jgi:hypothetical protein
MIIASASKWFFSTYVVELKQGQLNSSDLDYLRHQSGHTNFEQGAVCPKNATVSTCLSEPAASGGTWGDYVADTDGYFYYGGGHMQVMAARNEDLGLAQETAPSLTVKIAETLGFPDDGLFFYDVPLLAGGVITSPELYARFLTNMLDGKYPYMFDHLGTQDVCTHANSEDCPTAIFSPINQSAVGAANDLSDEAWHYSLGHWVEDDPVSGDGALSNIGAFGFYAWIDQAKTFYGILARQDLSFSTVPTLPSIQCGRLIREAWLTGIAPSVIHPVPLLRDAYGRLALFLGILGVMIWYDRRKQMRNYR